MKTFTKQEEGVLRGLAGLVIAAAKLMNAEEKAGKGEDVVVQLRPARKPVRKPRKGGAARKKARKALGLRRLPSGRLYDPKAQQMVANGRHRPPQNHLALRELVELGFKLYGGRLTPLEKGIVGHRWGLRSGNHGGRVPRLLSAYGVARKYRLTGHEVTVFTRQALEKLEVPLNQARRRTRDLADAPAGVQA